MKLSTGEKIEELYGRTSDLIGFGPNPDIVCSPREYQDPDLKDSQSPFPQNKHNALILFRDNYDAVEPEEFFFSDKIELIEQAIVETIFEMKKREALNGIFIEWIDSKIENYSHELTELKHWTLGTNASIEVRRIHLEKELLQLEKEKRINNLNCWRDLLALKKDLREALTEYKSLMRIKNIFS